MFFYYYFEGGGQKGAPEGAAGQMQLQTPFFAQKEGGGNPYTRLQPYTLVSPVASAQRPDRVTVAIRLGLQCCLVSAEWVEGERQENPRLKPLKTAKNFRLWRGPPGPARDVKR